MARVNCKELSPGDSVHFRCGGSCVVDDVAPSHRYARGIFVSFVGTNHGISVSKAGKLYSRYTDAPVVNCPFDIVKITKHQPKD